LKDEQQKLESHKDLIIQRELIAPKVAKKERLTATYPSFLNE